MANEYNPMPLFDALEHLSATLDIQTPHIKSCLPNTLSLNDVLADYHHSCGFLNAYRGSAETFKSYRREIERLLQWTWIIRAKPIKDLRRSDLDIFMEFCQSPP